MSKTLGRDIQILIKVIKYIDKMKMYIKKNNVNNISSFTNSEECKDMCAFCILQISELSKQMTKDTYNCIPFLSNGSIIPVRNMIAHDYLGLQLSVLYAFVNSCVAKENISIIKDRIKYCQENKR